MESKEKKESTKKTNALGCKDVIEKYVAVIEFQKFIKFWTHEETEDWKIEDEYPQVLKAMQKGLINIDKDSKIVYTLAFPINSEEGNFNLTEISFRTRIKPSDLSRITKGLNIVKQQVEYTHRCLAYVTGEPKPMLDRFDRFDYKVIEQISTVFF